MIELLAALILQTTPAPETERAAGAMIHFFDAVGDRARILGSCTAFNAPDALDALGDEVLALPEWADVRDDFEAPLRSILADAHAAGAARPVESGLTPDRCASLSAGAAQAMADRRPALRDAVAYADSASPASD